MQLPGCSQRHAHEDGASTASMTVTNVFLRFFNPYHSQSLRSRCAAETESKRHSLITSKPDKQESQSGRELRTAYAIRRLHSLTLPRISPSLPFHRPSTRNQDIN